MGPARLRRVVDVVCDLVALERGPQRGGNGARDAEPFVAVVEDVQEGKAGIFVNGRRGGRVDQVPGRADVGVGNGEGVVEVLKGGDCG